MRSKPITPTARRVCDHRCVPRPKPRLFSAGLSFFFLSKVSGADKEGAKFNGYIFGRAAFPPGYAPLSGVPQPPIAGSPTGDPLNCATNEFLFPSMFESVFGYL